MIKIYNLLNLLKTHCQNINMGFYDDISITFAITNSISNYFDENDFINILFERLHTYYKISRKYDEKIINDIYKYCTIVEEHKSNLIISDNSISFIRKDFTGKNDYKIHKEIVIGDELSLIKLLESKFMNNINDLNDIDCIMFMPIKMYKKLIIYSKNKEYNFSELFL